MMDPMKQRENQYHMCSFWFTINGASTRTHHSYVNQVVDWSLWYLGFARGGGMSSRHDFFFFQLKGGKTN